MVDKQKQGTRNREWGKICERLAAEYFLKEGYTIRERNWRMGKAEVDLILETGRTIVFVEVKGRQGNYQDAVSAVDENKRKLMIRAADVYMRRLPVLSEYRFDIIAFTGNENQYTMDYYKDAFLPQVNGGRGLR